MTAYTYSGMSCHDGASTIAVSLLAAACILFVWHSRLALNVWAAEVSTLDADYEQLKFILHLVCTGCTWGLYRPQVRHAWLQLVTPCSAFAGAVVSMLRSIAMGVEVLVSCQKRRLVQLSRGVHAWHCRSSFWISQPSYSLHLHPYGTRSFVLLTDMLVDNNPVP
jgi:hypothetical protein